MRLRFVIFFLPCILTACGHSGPSQLFAAIDAGDAAAVKRAAAIRSNISATRNGWTPLHVICNLNETGSVPGSARHEIVSALIAAGADVNAFGGPNTTGLTPLDFAAVFDLQHEADLLLGAGADPNRSRDRNSRPLHYAVMAGNANMVKVLLKHKADPNLQSNGAEDTAGMNCLHLAARGIPRGHSGSTTTTYETPPRQLEIIRDLLAAHTSITALDAKGRTPFSVAEAFNQTEAAILLRELENKSHMIPAAIPGSGDGR